ncbi:hypothetical protein KEM52_004447, partial [Ascosphaera acerosa]
MSWWHDPAILASTGAGMDAEEQRAWHGWWNEYIVQLVRLSMQQADALTVLLTGRAEAAFAHIISRMLAAKGLAADLLCLKPARGPDGQLFASTLAFKQALLDEIMLAYPRAEEIRIYEDRPRHVEQFRDYFDSFNRRRLRPPIAATVVEVAELTRYLDPVAEAAEVQRMVNLHNQAVADGGTADAHRPRLSIRKSVFFTGYL